MTNTDVLFLAQHLTYTHTYGLLFFIHIVSNVKYLGDVKYSIIAIQFSQIIAISIQLSGAAIEPPSMLSNGLIQPTVTPLLCVYDSALLPNEVL